MIKDKITYDLKKRFLEEIERSIKTGKETGFLICLNDILYAPKKRCTGTDCGLFITYGDCPDKVQGGFHTHPYLPDIEKFYGRKPTEKELKRAIKIYKRDFAKAGITLQTPSHHDTVDTLINQCIGQSEGTMCIGSDLDTTKVECWTVKGDNVKIKDCSRATEEHKQKIEEKPREWIKPLFEKEIINL
jgi:hypothetical protein